MPKPPASSTVSASGTTEGTKTNRIELKTIDAGNFTQWLRGTADSQIAGKDAEVPCGDCNGCCKSFYFIHVTPKDTAALAAIPEDLLFPAPGAPAGHFVMGYNDEGHCPMLVDDRCSIYSARPQTCRAYDCRIFTAAGMQPGETDKALVSERTRRWEFSYESSAEQDQQQAVAQAARWLQAEQAKPASQLPADFLPRNSTQLAVLALQLHPLFAPGQFSAEQRDSADFAAAVVRAAASP